MIYKLYGDTYAVRLERGEEVVASIAELCEKEGIRAGTVQGLGAADDATVGLYSIAEKKYYPTELKGDMEITALISNISRQEGADAPYLHLHITLAKAGGQAVGGHLNRAVISATSELFVRKLPGVIGRFADPETGLNLTRFDLD